MTVVSAVASTGPILARHRLEARLERLRSEQAWANYVRAREWVLDVLPDRPGDAGGQRPSRYWEEELETLDFMFDASPFVIDRLRLHTYPITGIRGYDYRTGKSDARERFADKLAALDEFGCVDLRVPEAPFLGGFGHEIDGGLYNIDTLKYYESLIALAAGGVARDLRESSDRRVVCEIGSGWGGLAYQFKTLFPNVTYVMIDLPELFLFSATYLPTVLPHATCLFYDPSDPPTDDEWIDADLVFIPNHATNDVAPPRLDLTVNTVSFQEMTSEQVEAYVAWAYGRECPIIYSLNRARSLYNTELESVDTILDHHYWLNEIEVLPVSYMKMLPDPANRKKSKAKKAEKKRDLDYHHLLGRRRVTADA